MLRNERYVGRVTWNKRRWRRGGPKKKRRSKFNPTEAWDVREQPELRIIDNDLWAKVQAKVPEQRKLGAPRSRARAGRGEEDPGTPWPAGHGAAEGASTMGRAARAG
jgi:hypothetical protein